MQKIYSFISLIVIITLSSQLYSQNWKEAIQETDKLIDSKNYSEARKKAIKSLELAAKEFGEKTKYYAQSLSRLAGIAYLSGNYDDAINYFIKEKDLLSEIAGTDDPAYAKALNNLSVIYQSQGRLNEAEKTLLETVRIKKSQNEIDFASLAKTLNNLGQLYQEQGMYEEAEPVYIESVELKKKYEGESTESYGLSLLNLGILYKNLGNYNKANDYLSKSVETLNSTAGSNNTNTLKANFNLAMTLIALGRQTEAEPILKQNIEYMEKGAGKDSPDYASVLYNMAMLKWATKDLNGAKALLNQAMTIIEKKFGNSHPLYSSCLNSLGVISWVQDDLNSAKEFLKNAVYLRKLVLGEYHPDYATAVHNYAGLMKDMGNYDEAEKNYHLAFELYLKQIQTYFSFLSEKEKAEFYATLKERFEMFDCYAITRYQAKPELLCDMYDFQLATKALLLNASKKVRKKIIESGNAELTSLYEKWTSLKDELSRLYNLSKLELKKSNINVDSLENLANSIEKKLSARSSAFDREYSFKKVSWKDIQKSLNQDEAAIEIVRFNFFEKEYSDKIFYAALILTSETKNHPELVLLQNGRELEEKYLKNYKNSINFKLDDNDSYKVFWKKIDEKITSKKTIYISLDGVYNVININALKKPDGSYVIEAQYIKYVTNTKDIIESGSEEKIGTMSHKAYLFGNPSYNLSVKDNSDNSTLTNIPELPGTKLEIEQISSILKKDKWETISFSENEATERNFKRLKSPLLIHIASHGYFLSDLNPKERQKAFGIEIEKAMENPLLRSGILFCGAANALSAKNQSEDTTENGILYAYEAMNLDFDNVGLLVLSACETGLGEIKNGEGVYGLQRAFQVAGAHHLIMSLWKIDDVAAQQLMSDFYSNWVGGKNYADALRSAQLKLKETYPHPYFWGPFVMIGK